LHWRTTSKLPNLVNPRVKQLSRPPSRRRRRPQGKTLTSLMSSSPSRRSRQPSPKQRQRPRPASDQCKLQHTEMELIISANMSDGDDVKPPAKKAAPAKAKPKAKVEPMILDDSDDDESMSQTPRHHSLSVLTISVQYPCTH
jgi:hypothetical protein